MATDEQTQASDRAYDPGLFDGGSQLRRSTRPFYCLGVFLSFRLIYGKLILRFNSFPNYLFTYLLLYVEGLFEIKIKFCQVKKLILRFTQLAVKWGQAARYGFPLG